MPTHPNADDKLLPLVGLIYDAVDQPALWPSVLDRISQAVRGEGAFLFADYPQPDIADLIATARMDPAFLVPYSQHYSSVNVLAQEADRIFPDCVPRYSHEAVPDEKFEKTEFYNDYAKPIFYYSAGLNIPLANQKPAHLGILRAKSAGPFEQEEGAVLLALLPHLVRALALHLQFCRLRAHVNGMHAALSSFEVAVFGLDRSGRAVFMNEAARRILRLDHGLVLSGAHLKACSAKQDSELQFLVSAATATGAGRGCSPGGALLVNRKSDDLPFRVTVTPFTSTTVPEFGALAALVFVHDPGEKTQTRQAGLRALYRLTPAECRLADLLAAGHELSGIAEIARLTINSVRFQLKSVFRKTGTNRQSELVRLVLSLPATVHEPSTS